MSRITANVYNIWFWFVFFFCAVPCDEISPSSRQSLQHFVSQRGFVNFDFLNQGGDPTNLQLSSRSALQFGDGAGNYSRLVHAETLLGAARVQNGGKPGLEFKV